MSFSLFIREIFFFRYENCGSKFSLEKIRRSFFKIKEGGEREGSTKIHKLFTPSFLIHKFLLALIKINPPRSDFLAGIEVIQNNFQYTDDERGKLLINMGQKIGNCF